MNEPLLSVEVKLSHIPESCLGKVLDDLSDYLEGQGIYADVGVAHEEED